MFSVVKFPLSVGNVLGNLYPSRYGPNFTGWGGTESGYPTLMEIGDPKGGRPPRNVVVGPVDYVHESNAELVSPEGYRWYASFCMVCDVPGPSPSPVEEEYDS